jgi:membrane protease YdiL (CAAX protease family)
MVTTATTGEARHGLAPHLRGHLLLFERRPADAPRGGARLLLAAVLMEGVRLTVLAWLYPTIPLALLLAGLLGLALLMVPTLAGLKLDTLGFRPWRAWTLTEKSYLVQVVLIANVVFPLVLAEPLQKRMAQDGMAGSLWGVFLPYLVYGFYQELVYRGMVQSELVRRGGAPIGILAANALYVFGPLHWNYFASRGSLAVPMFAAIFAIGLFFGVLYHRSRNLWLVAIFHAIGNAYMASGVGAFR